MAGTKYLKHDGTGLAQEVAANDASAGAADAGKIVALNGAGVLAASIVNAKATSVGVGDAGKIPSLDGAGRLDPSFLPVGLGADTLVISASEALAAGAYVNVWSSAGAFKVRNADATVAGKEAHGFVLNAVASGANATVYFESTNTSVTGQTPGVVYLANTPGAGTATPPNAAGNVVQRLGFAASATTVSFQSENPIVLA